MVKQLKHVMTAGLLLCAISIKVPGAEFSNARLAQLFMLGYERHDMQAMSRDSAANVGGIILFKNNIFSYGQLQQDIAKLKRNNSRLLVAVDQEGGRIQRLHRWNGFASFTLPPARQIAQGTDEQARVAYEHLAMNLAQLGINVNLVPVVDVEINPSGVIAKDQRSYGSIEKIVRFSKIVIESHARHGVLTSLKHFPGHGSAYGDTHEGFSDVTREWSQIELKPYRQLLRLLPESIHLVMSSHLYNAQLDDRYPASLSTKTIRLLTDNIGYQGAIISDDMSMSALAGYNLKQRLMLAFNAGHHMLIFSNQHNETVTLQELVRTMQALLKAGGLAPAIINQALDKVDQLKAWIKPVGKP